MLPKYIRFSGAELIKFLSDFGFVLIRTKGSHAIVQKNTPSETITVPIPLHKDIKIGTLNSIIRQTGLAKETFILK
jgi:predicted RNA binding protein YcfA (HicA-like mRNA interferase family)